MYKYEVVLYRINADDRFVAEVPGYSGCMAHGDTQEVAFHNIFAATALWLDTSREFGDPIPESQGRALDAGLRRFMIVDD